MRNHSTTCSGIFTTRAAIACALFCIAALLGTSTFISHATPAPTSGTLSTSNRSITYMDSTGSLTNPSAVALGKPDCTAPMSCSTFTLTIDPSVGTAAGGYDPTQYQIFINEVWGLAANDYDTFVEDSAGNVVAQNLSTADPETITLPTSTPSGVYTIILVMATGAPVPYTGTIVLQPKPLVSGLCGPPADCTPPRYQNYPAGPGQADNAGEPSLGVDWNPNVPSLQLNDATHKKNLAGVAFFTSGPNEWRVNFDDCPSPALNVWEDVTATTTQQFVLSDPIGFVDHYTSAQLGVAGPMPHTPGRVFTLDLIGGQGDSLGSFSDNDGNSYLPGGNGGPGQGPDHETLGGGPYNLASTPPPPPQSSPYPATGTVKNAIYYCSQNIVAEAQCSRSDNGGMTFGPAVPIYNPSVCTGGIHGHVKVAPDGTVYVPNSSCGTSGLDGVAVSTDNGLTWTENNVSGSTGSQDPSVGIGQNNVGKSAGNLNGTNTIYLGWISGDGHAHVAHSGNRGATWTGDTDVGNPFGVTHGVFPVVVAGDDNRAAFGFLGTGDGIATSGSCDPYGATLNCANIWHLYIATTYDGGNNWIVVDATPNDPVQQGTICLQGTTCAGGRNLLDFNDFAVDSLGRGMVGYADGCVNCDNTFGGQSSANHGTVARQSGGRRLFHAFDPIEPMPPAAPQMLSATAVVGGGLVTWLEPDNGGSPITGYNVYRGATSGSEVFLAHVNGETTTKYLDPTPLSPTSYYWVQAISGFGEGGHCGELLLGVCLTCVNPCDFPYSQVDPAGSAGNVPSDPTMGELTIGHVNIGEPFTNCADNSITFLMKVSTLDPSGTGNAVLPPNAEWQILFGVTDTLGHAQTVYVELDTFAPNTPATPGVSYGRRDPCSAGCSTLDSSQTSTGVISATTTKDGYIVFKLNAGTPLPFAAAGAPGVGGAFTWDASQPGTILGTSATRITGNTFLFVGVGAGFLETVQTTSGGTYTRAGNVSCVKVPPVARLTASPMTGAPPLLVNFDGSTSSDATPCGVVINSYTMDFGDGTPTVTQAGPAFTHTYTAGGDYPARLTVKDTLGQVSTNVAQVIISVSTTPPPLNRVDSVKTHGSAGQLHVPLQKDATTRPRGVECRNSGTNNSHTIVFTFQNNLVGTIGTDPATASVVLGPGSVIPGPGATGTVTGIGPGQSQYTVNLTGATNANYVSVVLHNVSDTAGNIGNVGTTMGVLQGDVTGNGVVTNTDVSVTKGQVNPTVLVTDANCREDVSVNGVVTNTDVSIVKGQVNPLGGLPSTP